MRQISQYSKRGKAFIAAYWKSNNYSLDDCYKSYSNEKRISEENCRSWMYSEGGYGFKIISYNTFGFTCGWQEGANMRIETPQNSYIIKNCIAPF